MDTNPFLVQLGYELDAAFKHRIQIVQVAGILLIIIFSIIMVRWTHGTHGRAAEHKLSAKCKLSPITHTRVHVHI